MWLVGRCYVFKRVKNGEADGVNRCWSIKGGGGFCSFDKANDVSFSRADIIIYDQRCLFGEAWRLTNTGVDLLSIDRIDYQPASAVEGFFLDAHGNFSDDLADTHMI